ncbi:parthenolide synthase [Lactuca sativa]|nr:parthenolide synthase [Lactuca sativa]
MEIFSIFPSWLLPTLLFLSMFCIFLYTLKSNKSSMVAPKLPPNPPKLPFIGNMHQLLGQPRHLAFWKLSQEYGPIMLLKIGSKPCVIISSSAMAKQVLKDQDHILCSRPINKTTKQLTYNYVDTAFTPYSNHWRKMRKVLVSEFLGPNRARLSNHVLLTEVEIMLRSVSLHPSNNAINLNELFFALVKAVTFKVALGLNYREQPLKGPSFEMILDEVLELMNPSFGDFFPWLGKIIDQISGRNHKLGKVCRNLDAYIQSHVDDHDHKIHINGQVDDDDKDFLHTLLELSSMDNASDDDRLTKTEIKSLIVNIFTGGIDTTVATMVWAMSEIIRSPRVMQKLQSEIRNCAGRKQKLDEMDVSKMTYLKMVVKETLRLHPPAALLLPHESLSHCQIGGYDVLPDTMVLINGWVIGRDPNKWGENAAEFYPERFENLEVDFRGGNYEMVPFGGGRRTCPAVKTAPATVEFTIANLLYWYDWKIPGGVKNEDLDMLEEGSLVLHRKLPLCLIPIKHNWEE